jgi:hypothetical protein
VNLSANQLDSLFTKGRESLPRSSFHAKAQRVEAVATFVAQPAPLLADDLKRKQQLLPYGRRTGSRGKLNVNWILREDDWGEAEDW